MNKIHSIFFKTLVSAFYQRHAGLFLVFFLLMFGVIPPQNLLSYHQKLMQAFLGDHVLRIIVFFSWLLYSLKCIQFAVQQLDKKEQEFLFEANALEKLQRLSLSLAVLLWMLLPVLIYGLIAIVYAAGIGLYIEASQIFLCCIFLSVFSAIVIDYKISHMHDTGLTRWFNYLSLRVKKPYVVIMLLQMLNDFKVVFFITKLLSIVCIYIAFAFCDKGVYDMRVILLGLLFSMLAHVTLLFELRKFEETKLLYIRNTPQTITNKLIQYTIIILLILIPETLVMLNAIPEKILWEQLPVFILFCVSMLLAFFSTMYKLPFNKDKSIIYPTYIVLVVFFLVLYNMVAVIIFSLLVLSLILTYNNFYRFELIEEKE